MSLYTSTHREIILVTGPARSGKSEWAEYLADQKSPSVIYIATSQEDPTDLEWQARLEKHRLRRPSHWQTQAVPVDLNSAIAASPPASCLLVDSLGTWVANLLSQDDGQWQLTQQKLLTSLQTCANPIIFVAEETGWGVVPAYPLGRQFRDRLGNLTRSIGAIADKVYLVTGGHVLDLSQLGKPLPHFDPHR
ncbi:MAG: bifunctional adenosylcobinamide kinase/adenosylcobinamide-phosphate guanylyltransferase [Snowella sp.]|nr:bifunctional adenosylcobinamide kinase/adenosylcobinamide-phosphate guanylyltransferase [Snowella sp.]